MSWAGLISWPRKDHAIRRHWELVCCAFVFCWWYADCRWRVSNEMRHPGRIVPPSERSKKNRRHENDAMLAAIAACGLGLGGPGVLAGAFLGRVLCSAPPPELVAMIEAVVANQGINLYLRI